MGELDQFIPADVRPCVDALVTQYEQNLYDNLLGIYIHGSIAMGCFNPQSSDIDVLVTVNGPLQPETKQALANAHIALSNEYKKKVELSVVTSDALNDFVYPTPYEFHYGDELKLAYTEGTFDFSTNRTDHDLAAHFVITKHAGITIRGEQAQNAFPEVPYVAYLDSMARDAEWCFNNIMNFTPDGTCPVPTYAVLNLCRVLAIIDAGQVTSKRSGGEWALDFVPNQFRPVIQEALNEYQAVGSAQQVQSSDLRALAAYAYERIKQKWQANY
jgi:predicted nucleotidyltransferase